MEKEVKDVDYKQMGVTDTKKGMLTLTDDEIVIVKKGDSNAEK